MEKARFFGLASTYQEIKTWLKSLTGKAAYVLHAEAGSFGFSGGEAKLSVWSGKGDGSVEARLDALEKNVQTLREEQGDTEKKLQEEVRNRVEDATAERRARESAIGGIRSDFVSFGAGGIRMERWGVFWLSLSLLFSAWSELYGRPV